MLKKSSLFLLMVIALKANVFAQSGFLGSTINVNAQVEVVPVISAILSPNYSTFKSISPTLIKFKKNFVDYKFSMSASKVLNDDYEVGVVLNYASFGIIADNFNGVDTNFIFNGYTLVESEYSMLSVLKAKSKGVSFNIKKFNKGLSPIGKYVGLNLGFGSTTADKDAEIVFGERSVSSSRFLYKSYVVQSSDTTVLSYKANVNTFNASFLLGRTIPINKKLGIDLSMSVPIFRILFYNGRKSWAYSVKSTNTTIDASSATELNRSIAYSIRRNQGFSLNVGLKYFI